MKYINKFIIFFVSYFVITLHFVCVNAVDIQIANDFSNILSTETISLRFNLSAEDQAVYKEFLRFSIDLDNVELKNWHALIRYTEQYIPLFRQNKKLYSDSFNIEINLRLWRKGAVVTEEYLKKANLYVVCVVLNKRGENVSYNVVLPLWTGDTEKKEVPVVAVENVDKQKDQEVLEHEEVEVVSRGEIVWSGLTSVYDSLLLGFKNFLKSAFFGKFYVLLWMLVLLFCLGRLFFSWPLIEFWRFIFFLWLISSFYFMQFIFSLSALLLIFSVVCLAIAVYCLRLTRKPETFGEKFKNLIGLILAILALPLFVKACLLGSYFGVDKWLK